MSKNNQQIIIDTLTDKVEELQDMVDNADFVQEQSERELNFAVDFIAHLMQKDDLVFNEFMQYTQNCITGLKNERKLYDNDYDVTRATIYRLEDTLGEGNASLEVISDWVCNDNFEYNSTMTL